MKKIGRTLFIVLLLFAVASTALAHPGRTDGSGGHYNRSTGEYHYHHGYPEHDHYDVDGDGDIDCPYDFKNNESPSGSSSSTSGTGSNWISGKGNPQTNDDRSDAKEDSRTEPVTVENEPTFWGKYSLHVICTTIIVILSIYVFAAIIKRKRCELAKQERIKKEIEAEQERKRKEMEAHYQKIVEDLHRSRKRTAMHIFANVLAAEYNAISTQQNALVQAQSNCITDPAQITDIPKGTSVDSDGLPYWTADPYGYIDPYVFSLSDSGIYHNPTCRYARIQNHINAVRLQSIKIHKYRHIRPCSFCYPHIPDLSWLYKYVRIRDDIDAVNSVTNCTCPEIDIVTHQNSPYHELFHSDKIFDETTLAKKALHWFELEDAEALLRFVSRKESDAPEFLIRALQILCNNYYAWDKHLKNELMKKLYPGEVIACP